MPLEFLHVPGPNSKTASQFGHVCRALSMYQTLQTIIGACTLSLFPRSWVSESDKYRSTSCFHFHRSSYSNKRPEAAVASLGPVQRCPTGQSPDGDYCRSRKITDAIDCPAFSISHTRMNEQTRMCVRDRFGSLRFRSTCGFRKTTWRNKYPCSKQARILARGATALCTRCIRVTSST